MLSREMNKSLGSNGWGGRSCTMAFMIPVATPPNAIVYETGYIEMRDMVRNGFFLDLVAATVWTLLFYSIIVRISLLA